MMLVATPGFILHTTPYGESSVVAKVFTRQLGLRSYIVKGVRTPRGRVKQNLLQPLSCVDMVVYDNPRNDLNHIRELTPHSAEPPADAVGNALRFFMTEVLYKALREEEPMPELFDYVESSVSASITDVELPVVFMINVARHLGIEPLDNYNTHEPYFDLQDGRYVSSATETTLSPDLSMLLHSYLSSADFHESSLQRRSRLLDALLVYYQLHLSGFRNFHSHEILHTILR